MKFTCTGQSPNIFVGEEVDFHMLVAAVGILQAMAARKERDLPVVDHLAVDHIRHMAVRSQAERRRAAHGFAAHGFAAGGFAAEHSLGSVGIPPEYGYTLPDSARRHGYSLHIGWEEEGHWCVQRTSHPSHRRMGQLRPA
jgi:hypothetical protein